MLQYPTVIREAAELRKKGVGGVHIEVALKKVSNNPRIDYIHVVKGRYMNLFGVSFLLAYLSSVYMYMYLPTP